MSRSQTVSPAPSRYPVAVQRPRSSQSSATKKATPQRWEQGFARLQAYAAEKGNCLVPQRFRTADGYRLGIWVQTQRTTKKRLSAARRARLDELGFVWDPHEQDWDRGLAYLRTDASERGDCLVPKRFRTVDGYRLGVWVSTQRESKDALSALRRQRLDELGFVWDCNEQGWEQGLAALRTYAARKGSCVVPGSFKTADGFRLGIWAYTQRTSKAALSPSRRRRLDELGFVWNAHELLWEQGFASLRAYVEEKGDCLVPQGFQTADGFGLGIWVSRQRSRKSTLSPGRRRQLEALGFAWSAKASPKAVPPPSYRGLSNRSPALRKVAAYSAG